MEIPEHILPFWTGFLAATGTSASARPYDVFHFDDNERSADALAELVLLEAKRATAALLWSFEAENRPPPKPGDLSVVTDWAGNARCVIETTGVDIVAFAEVDAEFAQTEGEGDKSLAYWRQAHTEFFTRECERLGREFDARTPVVCERFALRYRG